MLHDWQGKRLKANGCRSIQAVKSQFRKAGHTPGTVSELVKIHDGEDNILFRWHCLCGATMQFEKQGRTFTRLRTWGGK